MEYDSIQDNLEDLLAKAGGKVSILEEQIDVDLQVEFFEIVNKELKRIENFEIFDSIKQLENSDLSFDEKKVLLVRLSNTKSVEDYRIIQKFIEKAEGDIRSWAILALQHARIGLESDLLDEEQVFISTGLGGHGECLRYFIVGKLKIQTEFSESQKKVINNEFEQAFKEHNSKIESLSYVNEFITLIALIPIQKPISEVINVAISEANNYGDFLIDDYLVTNVKLLNVKDIQSYFKKRKFNSKSKN
ncbi:MAG: hypothetical protein JEY96_01080 [Bacteroidales bacterium]|nr:hypothetical protein [Bacteroidales bacterium]